VRRSAGDARWGWNHDDDGADDDHRAVADHDHPGVDDDQPGADHDHPGPDHDDRANRTADRRCVQRGRAGLVGGVRLAVAPRRLRPGG
jgi:hypothetical protein